MLNDMYCYATMNFAINIREARIFFNKSEYNIENKVQKINFNNLSKCMIT